jgi:hypothetical protein
LSPLEPLRVIWHWVRAEASLATHEPLAALEEAQRGMAVNPSSGQLYVVGAAAAWRLGGVEQAHAWVATLRRHAAFCSLSGGRSRDPTMTMRRRQGRCLATRSLVASTDRHDQLAWPFESAVSLESLQLCRDVLPGRSLALSVQRGEHLVQRSKGFLLESHALRG